MTHAGPVHYCELYRLRGLLVAPGGGAGGVGHPSGGPRNVSGQDRVFCDPLGATKGVRGPWTVASMLGKTLGVTWFRRWYNHITYTGFIIVLVPLAIIVIIVFIKPVGTLSIL